VVKWFGYKIHLLVDTKYEMPLSYEVTKASASDTQHLLPLVEEVKKKHDFLEQQTTDLRKAQKTLVTLIQDLDQQISNQFQQGFKNINALFTKYFKKLFSGGSAKLILNMNDSDDEDEETDEDDTKEESMTAKISFNRFFPPCVKLGYSAHSLIILCVFRFHGFAERIFLISACVSCGVPVVFTR